MNIEHIACHIPKNSVPLSQLCNANELSRSEAAVMERIMGLKMVIRDPSRTPYDNICDVVTLLLEQYAIKHDGIAYVFIAHTADYITPFEYNLSDKIKRQFQFNQALCFGAVLNKCATPFHFFYFAKQLFSKLSKKNYILIINSDTAFTPIVKSISGSTVMGDAASAILLSKIGNDHHFIDVEMMLDDRFSNGVFGNQAEKLLFQSIYIEKLIQVIETLLNRNNLTLPQIKLILPHNVNTSSWAQLAKKLSISIDKIYLRNVARYGHCFGSDPFINLHDALLQQLIKKNDYYLLVTVGLGATFAAMLLQY